MTHVQRFHCFNPIKNNDKVYILTMKQRADNTFDVLGQYGRRGHSLTPHIIAANQPEREAVSAFERTARLRLAHDYKPVERIPA